MCTRYSLHQVEALKLALAKLGPAVPARLRELYNIAPSVHAPIVARRTGVTALAPMSFGLQLPPAQSGGRPLSLVNARSETMFAKGTFKDAVQHRRCLVPADGFYEWEHAGTARLPHYFRRRDGALFFFAGLWRDETETSPPAFVIVTTTPNELVGRIHSRMPVLLEEDAATTWLGDQPLPEKRLAALCAPFPAAKLVSHRVAPRMNNARHEGSDCIAPFAPPPPERGLFD